MRLAIAVSCLLPLTFSCASAQEAMPKDMHHTIMSMSLPHRWTKRLPPRRSNRGSLRTRRPHRTLITFTAGQAML